MTPAPTPLPDPPARMPARLLIILGSALAILLGVSAWVVYQRGVGGMDVVAVFPEVTSLRQGARVEYRGVDVGTVNRIELKDTVVVLRLRLTRTDIPLRNTDGAALRTPTPLGDRIVEIVPGTGTGRAWREGDTLRAVVPDPAALRRQAAVRDFWEAAMERMFKPDSLRAPAQGSP